MSDLSKQMALILKKAVTKEVEPEFIKNDYTTISTSKKDKQRLNNLQLTINKKDLEVNNLSLKEVVSMAIDLLEKDFTKKYGEILIPKSKKK